VPENERDTFFRLPNFLLILLIVAFAEAKPLANFSLSFGKVIAEDVLVAIWANVSLDFR
jgi:hypothetical protein